jgi:septum formation protein
LLAAAGVAVECVAADVREAVGIDGEPRELAIFNAELKANAVVARRRDAVVIGADTIVVLGAQIFGKPVDGEDARRMLARLAGRTHEVITGVCVVDGVSGRKETFAESTFVRFRGLEAGAIDAYLARVDPLDKAGAYAAQDDRGEIIEAVEGSLENVIGLPVGRVVELLDQMLEARRGGMR